MKKAFILVAFCTLVFVVFECPVFAEAKVACKIGGIFSPARRLTWPSEDTRRGTGLIAETINGQSSCLIGTMVARRLVPGDNEAQAGERPLKLGLLSDVNLFADGTPQMKGLFYGLTTLGYKEGKDFVMERRNSNRDKALLEKQLQELMMWMPDIWVSASTTVAIALKKATAGTKTPVVFWSTEPVESQIVVSLDKPGGNLTGVTAPTDYHGQQLQFLKDLVPNLKGVGHFYNHTYGPAPATLRELQKAAKPLGLEIEVFEVFKVEDFEKTVEAMSKAGVGAFVVGPHPVFNINGERIGQLAQKYRLPAASIQSAVVTGGGVLATTPDFEKVWITGARIIDKIAKGAKPADIPVDQSTPFRMLISAKAIHALGLKIPDSVMGNADMLR